MHKSKRNHWVFELFSDYAKKYNKQYDFDLDDDLGALQLTRYCAGQYYDWHMDLGAEGASRRKITAVAELTPPLSCKGGGLEIFHGESVDAKIYLEAGDILFFPSFIMHRAIRVIDGVRWSLVAWFLGKTPLK
jgi:Rps23 Pro-64 3,4-dihydroxylase Tpa1-like proline 4-hydroxylase